MQTSLLLLFFQYLISSSLLRMAATFPVETSAMGKRSAAPDRMSDDYPDYQLGVRYDEYPTIVPKKRTAFLVNRVLVALKDALEDERRTSKIPSVFGEENILAEDVRSMDLQRRGQQDSKNGQRSSQSYFRCFFNAVSCF